MENNLSILITGDFCVTKDFFKYDLISDDVKYLFDCSDLKIINLECPIIAEHKNDKIIKTGPNLSTNKDILPILHQLNTSAVTLANNHILDYGPKALESTLESCHRNDIKTVGAGVNLKQASEPLFIKKSGVKIAVINFCENEWSIASSNSAGANPLDLIDNLKQIEKAKSKADHVILIIHGGHEYYNLPSPRMQKQYRFFAENGADIIVGHHPHCIGGYEIHNGVPIFYSLGNFIFTLNSNNDDWFTGLILSLQIDSNNIVWKLLPAQQNSETFKVSLLQGNEKSNIIKRVEKYSKIIANNSQLIENWDRLIDEKYKEQIGKFSPINVFGRSKLKGLFRRLKLEHVFERDTHYMSMLNNIRCEAHFDITKETLKKRIGGK